MNRRASVLLTVRGGFPGSLASLPLRKVICGETFCTSEILFGERKNMQCNQGRSCLQFLPDKPAAFSRTASNLHFSLQSTAQTFAR